MASRTPPRHADTPADRVAGRTANVFTRAWILLLLSGMAALAHELLWTRRLTDVLGAGQQATAAVLGCFFLGLALGSAWVTRLTTAPRRPWLAAALVEFGIALAALPALTLILWTGWIWPLLGTTGLLGWPGTIVKITLPVLVVVPPSLLMGMTLPLIAAAVVQHEGALARQGVWLYAANTLGGVIGLLGTVAMTLQWLGVAGAMSWAIAVNLMVGLGCLWTHQTTAEPDSRSQPGDGTTGQATACTRTLGPDTGNPDRFAGAAGSSASPASARKLASNRTGTGGVRQAAGQIAPAVFRTSLLVSFVSGAGFLATEILALHLACNVWPGCIFATTAVLATVIVILAAAACATPLLVSWRGPARRLLSPIVAMTAVATVLTPIAFVHLTNNMTSQGGTRGVLSFVAVVAGHLGMAVGPALMVAGLVLPMTFGWYGNEQNDRTGRRWGWLLAANGLGGLVGATAANNLLIPWLGMHNGFTAVAILYGLLAVLLAWTDRNKTSASAVAGSALLATVLIGGIWVRPLPLMTPATGTRIVDIHCGREGVVAVVDQIPPAAAATWRRALIQSNQFMLGSLGAHHSERRKMLLPLLLHPDPRRVGVIGLATGITAGAALDYPGVESLTTVEISPLITAAARFFAPANRRVGDDPRSRIVIEDGRTYMAAAQAAYDVVVGDLFRPWVTGVGRLYSREHFHAVRRALRPGGMYCQWLPMYQLDDRQFDIIAATFLRVFPRVYLIRGSFRSTVPALGLVGFRDGDIDWAGLTGRCQTLRASPRVVDPSLRRREGVLMYYLGSLTAADNPSPVINTLNDAWLEIDAARSCVSQAAHPSFLTGKRWLDFERTLRARLKPDAHVPADARRWSEVGQRICWLHRAIRRRVPVADALAQAINQALPAGFYADRAADWSAWPVPHE